MSNNIFKNDWILILSALLVLSVGLVVLYSISVSGQVGMESIFLKQVLFVGVGLAMMTVFSFLNYHYFRTYGTALYFLTLFVLGVVLFLGRTVHGTSGWFDVGGFRFQPAEMAKLSLIIFLASFISQKRSELVELVRLFASFVLAGIMILLVLKQPDFGSAMVLAGIWLGMNVIGGINKKHLTGMLIAGVVASIIGWSLLAPYQKDRIYNFVRPDADPKGSGYNVIQSIIAVGSGGIVGKGVGHGSQSQLSFLPEKHTDFVFAVVSEELGFIGDMFLLLLLVVILYRAGAIALSARDNFGYLVASGIQIMLFIQILVNVGMAIGMMPVTGIPLPLVSYGGSSLLTVCVSLGILLNVHSKRDSNGFLSEGVH